jgi:hypothetical protein
MPILNFKKQFAEDVESGKKRQTIRATRKRPIKAGEKLHLFCGLRTKNCRRLALVECLSVSDIYITDVSGQVEIIIDGVFLSETGKEVIAARDGFKNLDEMIRFFWDTHGLPFEGQMIRW